MEHSKKMIPLVLMLILSLTISTKKVIWDEVIAPSRLAARVALFNEWYSKFNPTSKVEAKVTEDPEFMRIGVYAKEDIKAEDVYLKLDRKHMIHNSAIYDTKIGPVIREIESKFGYDDYVNLLFYVLHEMNNPASEWKAYLDLLPRQPTSIVYKYWDRKKFIEDELKGKIVDAKYLNEKKAANYFETIVKNNTSILDPEFYNEENIEWACIILDSRIMIVNYEAFLIPMLDFANYQENPHNPSRILRPKFLDQNSTMTEIKAIGDVSKGEQLFENPGLNSENLLINHGIVLSDNYNDCYSMSLSFTVRKEDALREKRREFFSHFFLYDSNYMDMIDECISLRQPFSRRMLFYFYTLMMDESDLERMDPKRNGLEQDRYILENVKNELKGQLDLMPTGLERDMAMQEKETEPYKKHVLGFLIEQKKYVRKLIEFYHDEINKLFKEDIL